MLLLLTESMLKSTWLGVCWSKSNCAKLVQEISANPLKQQLRMVRRLPIQIRRHIRRLQGQPETYPKEECSRHWRIVQQIHLERVDDLLEFMFCIYVITYTLRI